MADEEETVKKVITKLRDYLQKYLSIDENFIRGLQARKLLNERDSSHLCAALSKGGNDALYGFLDHVSAFYVEETLETFCAFLDDYSKSDIRPRLGRIAARIRAEMRKHQPGAMGQADTPQDGDLVHTVHGGEPVFTIDKRSQKIEEIVDLYRRGGNNVSLPRIPELEDDFDDNIEAVSSQLSSADPQVIYKLHGMMRVKYGRYIHGVKPVELPSVPNTANGLREFITEKSTPYEILLVHHTVEALNCEDLKTTLQSYESKLADHLRLTLGSYKKRKVTLPLHKDHTHLAVTISKDQILLSLVLHIKEYLMKYLLLEETMFEGFGEGCTVLFFSILKIDAVLLAPKILSHSAELKRLFDITHLIVFDYFACDLERASLELPVTSKRFERQLLMRDLKKEMLYQFDQLQTSKAAHDRRQVVAVFEKVQQELISTKKKLEVVEEGFVEAEKMLRTLSSTVSWSEDKFDLSGGGTNECEDELFALAYEDGVKDKYMCHVYEKSESHRTRPVRMTHFMRWMYTTAKLHMVITYSTSHWSQIVRKYCKPDDEDWKLRTVIQDFTVEGDVLTANIPESSGPTWSCAIDGIDQVPTFSLDFTKRFPFEKDGPKLLEQAVKSSVYPPKLNLIASSDVHGDAEYNRSRFICLEMAGSSPGIQIPVPVVDRVEPGMREPEKISKPHSYRKAHEGLRRDIFTIARPSVEGHSSSSFEDLRDIVPHPMKVHRRSSSLELEEDFLSPLLKTGQHIPPSVQESGMTKAPLKSKATTLLLAQRERSASQPRLDSGRLQLSVNS